MGKRAPIVKVTLDRERTLKLDLEALEAFEEASGTNFFEMDGRGFKIKELRYLVWAGLLHEDPELKPDDVKGMIHIGNMKVVSQAISKLTKNA